MTTDYQTSQVTDPVRKTLCDWQIIQDGKQVRPLVRDELEGLLEKHGKGVNLSGADLRGIDLRGMDLSQSILQGCNLEGAIAMPLVTSISGKALPIGNLYYEKALSDWHNTGETSGGMKSVQPTQLDGAILNLSNLSHCDFRWASFDNAGMVRSNLQGANLSYAKLNETRLDWAKLDDATLQCAALTGASLKSARITDCDLSHADLQDVNLIGAFISPGTRLEGVNWGKDYINVLERNGDYQEAAALYRQLGEWHETAGFLSIASKFRYREMEARRKEQLKSLTGEFSGVRVFLTQIWENLRKNGNKG